FADESVPVGPPPSSQSYLAMDAILDVCLSTGSDAIHPGYGFLSENAEFAKKVRDAGILYIGPSAESIRTMGDKLASRKAVAGFNVPIIPGMDHPATSSQQALEAAEKIGYPVMIKASAGGGGKGMRIVHHAGEMESEMKQAMGEAQSSFGNASVFVEKYIPSPRHIEVQILGDTQGSIIHLFERECSIQRRNQKVMEEAPSSVLSPAQRKKICDAAINVARACQYYGAGTVEFVADQELNFYFLEMNTRLQVEHPVTEMITGLDLVKEQIRIAEGSPLPFAQDDIHLRGHSLEVRVYAEDPQNHFLPDTGTLHTYQRPQGPGVRVDDGYEEGMEIPIYYDPMIAKLITYASTREDAISRMQRAIGEYKIGGVKTTLPFCAFVLQHESFRSGKFSTKFVEQHFTPEMIEPRFSTNEKLAALLAVFHEYTQPDPFTASHESENKKPVSNWKRRARY
ncbi:MAG: ATP-grasp domain-containing protein, partial [Cyclobacteriaceae bacterium]|nr:ATP-grasp domain-containing protein [Cyclobacteriaceae bacterium]